MPINSAFGKSVITKSLHSGGEVLCGASGRHLEVPPALERLEEHEHIAGAFSAICIIATNWLAWSPRQRLTDLTDQ
jgi:hypothetical protein